MARDWTTTGLLSAVRRRLHAPASGAGGPVTSTDILQIADEVIDSEIVPAVQRVRAEFFLQASDVTPVADQATYRIPPGAISSTLRDVVWIRDDFGQSVRWLPATDIDTTFDSKERATHPPFFTVLGDLVQLSPAPQDGQGTLRLRYFQRPSKLVETSQAGTITAIGTLGGDDVDASGASAVTSPIDIVSATPPFAHRGVGITATKSLVAGGNRFIPTVAGYSVHTAVGDYVCSAGESPVPQIPANLHTLLYDGVAKAVAVQINDLQRAAFLEQRFQNSMRGVLSSLTPRVHGQSRYIINRHSFLRSGARFLPRGWFT